MFNTLSKIFSQFMRPLGLGSLLVALAAMPSTAQALSNEQCDLNDDGTINVLDLFTIIGLLGTEAGEEKYRDGLDLVLCEHMPIYSSWRPPQLP